MARKSNKTSHVLHLLAGEEPVPEEDKKEITDIETDTTGKGGPQENTDEKEPAQKAPEISIVTTGNHTDDPLSDLIREQLEETFEQGTDDIPAAEPIRIAGEPPEKSDPGEIPHVTVPAEKDNNLTSTEASVVGDDNTASTENSAVMDDTTASTRIPDTQDNDLTSMEIPDIKDDSITSMKTPVVKDNDITTAEMPATEDDSITTAETPAANAVNISSHEQEMDKVPQPAEPVVSPEHLNALLSPDGDEDSLHYRFINVMEYVVKDKVLDYMKRFGMCTCERCVVDTAALTLTLCSAKYIVVDKHTVSPLLNFYSNKYTGDVTVALTRACTMVSKNPRH